MKGAKIMEAEIVEVLKEINVTLTWLCVLVFAAVVAHIVFKIGE